MNPLVQLKLTRALLQYKRYLRKYKRLVESGNSSSHKSILLESRIAKLVKYLKGYISPTKLAGAVASVGFFLSSNALNAQVYAPATVNPFGITNPTISQNYNVITQGDLDGDGDKDILSTTYYTLDPYNAYFVYYQNTGSTTAPAFAAPTTNTNPFGLPSLANNIYMPTLVDLDNDGDLDIMAGSYSGLDLKYFQNTGTAASPNFAAPTSNPFGINTSSLHYWGMYNVDFADLDNDGDLDMMVGDYGATLHYFQNTGTSSAPAFAAPVANPFGTTAGFRWAAPELTDYDNDGDFDMMVGDRNNGFYYYKNTGTVTAPAFAAAVENPGNLGFLGSIGGFIEFDDYDNDGDKDMLVGSSILNIYYLENICEDFPPAPTSTTPTQNQTICSGKSTVLSASGTGTLSWFNNPTGGTSIGTGTSFTTPNLTVKDTFYVENNTCAKSTTRERIIVTINALPDVSTTTIGNTISASLSGATSYQWITCPAFAIAGGTSTNQSYTPTVNGDYSVIIDNGICVDTSSCVSITTVGLMDGQNNSNFMIYPNPSNGSFTIQATQGGNYAILNGLGQVIQTLELNLTNNYSAKVESLGVGVYYLNSLDASAPSRHKMVVIK